MFNLLLKDGSFTRKNNAEYWWRCSDVVLYLIKFGIRHAEVADIIVIKWFIYTATERSYEQNTS